MKTHQQRQYDRFIRTTEFLDRYAADFTSTSKAMEFRDHLTTVLDKIEQAGNAQQPKANKDTRNSEKLSALNALREELYDIEATATVIAANDPKFKNVFEVTDWRRKDELLATAKRFLNDAQKVTAKFEAYEMSGDFLERLQSNIDACEAVQVAKPGVQGKAERKDELAELIAEGAKLANILDVVVRNKYLGDAGKFDAWNAAWVAGKTARTK